MLATLLETTGATGLPSIAAGIIVFAVAMGLLIWVTGMGSGRPNTK